MNAPSNINGQPATKVAGAGPGRTWSPEMEALLADLYADHHTAREIAESFGLTVGAVNVKLSRMGLNARTRAAKEAGVKARPCMCCRTPFFSEGPHNRLCDACRSESGDYSISVK